jgi:hypothetical protein
MEYDHKKCKDCVLNGDCLFQDNNDVESCEGFGEDE